MSFCFTTVVSADQYSFFIPTFVYSAKRAYPDCGIKIFVRGLLPEPVKKLLAKMKSLRICANNNWSVIENQFTKYPDGVSICNTLRHLIPAKRFLGYDYVYVTDIDFIILPHKVSIEAYFAQRIQETGLPYASFRGPYNAPKRPGINGTGWKGDFVRIADGTLMLKNPEWFNKTKKMRGKYRELVKAGRSDGIDPERPASYREYNEVMLFRIARGSGLKTPTVRYKFVNGKGYNRLYRDIHIGDFRYNRRYRKKKMRRYIPFENVLNFRALEKEPAWQKICSEMEQAGHIRKIFKSMRHYM